MTLTNFCNSSKIFLEGERFKIWWQTLRDRQDRKEKDGQHKTRRKLNLIGKHLKKDKYSNAQMDGQTDWWEKGQKVGWTSRQTHRQRYIKKECEGTYQIKCRNR